jgi:glutamate---cysteine ligase / carboxylate-amine ligase
VTVTARSEQLVEWARWSAGGHAYSLGAEEEMMLLNPGGWGLAHNVDAVLASLPDALAERVSGETHNSAVEIASRPQRTAAGVELDLRNVRNGLARALEPMGLSAGSSGTHPFAVWHDTVISSGERYQFVYGSMRELARREPTFALHVHVGIPDPEDAIRLVNAMRTHVPLLLALSVNSPFWQGRDTGLASARTPLFQAFPRVGIPRRFNDYSDYVEAVDLLIRCGAFPEPTFRWWDVRPQPRFGTVEVRIMDAQTRVEQTAAIVALVQSLAHLEIEEGFSSEKLIAAAEVLDENRFLAARDGMDAELIDADHEQRIPVKEHLENVLAACAPHAEALGCTDQLALCQELSAQTGAERQIELARGPTRLPGLVATLAGEFAG